MSENASEIFNKNTSSDGNLLSEFQERKTEWNEKLDDWLISLSIGQNQMMEHIQTTELEEHEINLQGFVWTNCLNILLKKLARWDTENKSPFLTSVSDSGKNYHERFWLVRVMCATLKKQTRDSGWLRCGDGRQCCARMRCTFWEVYTCGIMWRAWWSMMTNVATDLFRWRMSSCRKIVMMGVTVGTFKPWRRNTHSLVWWRGERQCNQRYF